MAPLTVKLWCLYYHHSLETWVSGIRHVDERGLRDTEGERLQGVGMAQAEQYFAADPQSKDVRKRLHVVLRGNEADVEVSNGVFSGNRVDLGTSVLLRQAPEPDEAARTFPNPRDCRKTRHWKPQHRPHCLATQHAASYVHPSTADQPRNTVRPVPYPLLANARLRYHASHAHPRGECPIPMSLENDDNKDTIV